MLCPLKDGCALPGLRPLWQLATTLEALLRQLGNKESNVTASALKTVAGGLDLFQVLSVEEAKPMLAADSPVKLLAVDDDAVCLRALSLALQKAFDAPDLASNGHTGQALAVVKPYDLIFLDVEMPEMDGLELCRRIRKTALNRATPVVFVTRHSDFQSRAKTALSGGNDLIGKPFLALEITVKALTLVLRSRLQAAAPVLEAAGNLAVPAPILDEAAPAVDRSTTHKLVEPPAIETMRTAAAVEPPQAGGGREVEDNTPIPQSSGRFDSGASHIAELKSHVGAAQRAKNLGVRTEVLGELFVGVHKLTEETQRDGLNSPHRLSAVLEELLRKLVERPTLCTAFVLDAAADALDLLGELISSGADPDFAEGTFRILVVDDDPIARRTLGGSLQLVFGRPESAESGEAALDLAGRKHFDLILLDVMMPGMDGFETCVKIHQTEANPDTPILFVTSSDDAESRKRAADVGGCGFIAKPVLPKEIMLRTLTLTLRGRLGSAKPSGALAEAAC
jgi:CheY-like chemotaxis protein